MRLNLFCGTVRLPGFYNLDAIQDRSDDRKAWRAKDGLPFPRSSIEAVSISHGMSSLPLESYPLMLSELFRVVVPGGIVRIADGDNENPASRLIANPYREHLSLTGPAMMREYMRAFGFETFDMGHNQTLFRDDSLLQTWHGLPPDVFFMEGVKP